MGAGDERGLSQSVRCSSSLAAGRFRCLRDSVTELRACDHFIPRAVLHRWRMVVADTHPRTGREPRTVAPARDSTGPRLTVCRADAARSCIAVGTIILCTLRRDGLSIHGDTRKKEGEGGGGSSQIQFSALAVSVLFVTADDVYIAYYDENRTREA